MANRVIEAQLKLTGSDAGMGAAIDKVAKKLNQLEAAGKSAKAVDRMAASIERAKSAMAAVDRANAARGMFADARTRFREAQLAVERTARALAAAEAPTRALEQAHRSAARAVSMAARAFEQQKNEVLSSKRALESYGIPLKNAATEQERLRMSIERTTAAMARQERNGARRKQLGEAYSGATMLAGPMVLHAVKEAATGGAEIQSEIVRMRAAGISDKDIGGAVDQSASLAAKYTNVKRSTTLERYKELRSVLLHPEEASELLEPTVRANAAMNALDRTGHLSEGLGFAVKGAEVLGLAQDKERFEAYLNSFLKAQQVMGKTITPEQQYEFAKYTKASGSTLSDRFKMTTGVSLGQEMGGASTGVSVDQFVKQITGGFQGSQHSAAKEFVALGLANKDDFETTKTGEIKGLKHGRHVAGSDLAQTDPDTWVYKYLLPALEKAGITGKDAQVAQVRRMFPSGRAADLVAKLVTQRPSFENHAKLYEKAQGLDAIDNNQKDPFVALNSLTTSLQTFGATLTSPAMEGASTRLSSMASAIGSWSESLAKWQKDNPGMAAPAGAAALIGGGALGAKWTYGLISGLRNGFGLTASAASLNESAAALNVAAARLGAGGAASAVSTATAAAGAGTAAASPFLSRAAGAVPFVGPAVIIGGVLYQMTQEPGYDGLNINSARNRKDRGGSIRDANIRAFNEDRDRLGIPRIGQEDAAKPLSGEVTGRVTIDINDQRATVRGADSSVQLSGRIGTDGAGSVGKSSPDALPGAGPYP